MCSGRVGLWQRAAGTEHLSCISAASQLHLKCIGRNARLQNNTHRPPSSRNLRMRWIQVGTVRRVTGPRQSPSIAAVFHGSRPPAHAVCHQSMPATVPNAVRFHLRICRHAQRVNQSSPRPLLRDVWVPGNRGRFEE